MSADNAILILCLKDQCRVVESHAIDNLYWSWTGENHSEELVSSRVFEYFNKAKSFFNKVDAMGYAEKLYRKASFVEYGIVFLEVKQTWSQLLKSAREHLQKEKFFILNNPMKGRIEILEEINYSYSDVLKSLNEEKYAKR